jgi:hypothetical protein
VKGEVLDAVRRPVGRAHARRRLEHTRTGACPGQRDPAHRRGARVRRAEGPTSGHRFTTEVPGHLYAGGRLIRCVAKPERRRACDAAWELRRRRPSPVLFRLSVFEIAKLQKLSTNLKISKNKSCRGVIDLQLSQRATNVLSTVCLGMSTEVAVFPQLGLLFTARLTQFLANLYSKLECPPITKNVFPEITNNFDIGRF